MTLGHDLYADKPRLFVDRLRAYWYAWHGKAVKAASSESHENPESHVQGVWLNHTIFARGERPARRWDGTPL
jgi:hypothetical protein